MAFSEQRSPDAVQRKARLRASSTRYCGAPLIRGLHSFGAARLSHETIPGLQRTTLCCAAPGKSES
jgi:hypothetical protein